MLITRFINSKENYKNKSSKKGEINEEQFKNFLDSCLKIYKKEKSPNPMLDYKENFITKRNNDIYQGSLEGKEMSFSKYTTKGKNRNNKYSFCKREKDFLKEINLKSLPDEYSKSIYLPPILQKWHLNHSKNKKYKFSTTEPRVNSIRKKLM